MVEGLATILQEGVEEGGQKKQLVAGVRQPRCTGPASHGRLAGKEAWMGETRRGKEGGGQETTTERCGTKLKVRDNSNGQRRRAVVDWAA